MICVGLYMKSYTVVPTAVARGVEMRNPPLPSHMWANKLNVNMLCRQLVNVGIVMVLSLLFVPCHAMAQKASLSTNLLYWATTTPNITASWRLSNHYTLSATVGYNDFDFESCFDDEVNAKIHHWVVYPELKYWFCRSFDGGYLGIHAFYGEYNAGGIDFISFLKDYRYKGYATGAGISYGYQWALGRYWGLETSIGVGYVYLNYHKYECGDCGDIVAKGKRHYALPTKAAVSLVYYIK